MRNSSKTRIRNLLKARRVNFQDVISPERSLCCHCSGLKLWSWTLFKRKGIHYSAGYLRHHESYLALKKSKDSGCVLCNVLCVGYEYHVKQQNGNINDVDKRDAPFYLFLEYEGSELYWDEEQSDFSYAFTRDTYYGFSLARGDKYEGNKPPNISDEVKSKSVGDYSEYVNQHFSPGPLFQIMAPVGEILYSFLRRMNTYS